MRGHAGEDALGHVGDVLEPQRGEVDAGLLLHAVHDGVAQAALVGEVAVDGALVDAGPLGHGPHRQRPPVADRRALEELAARGRRSGRGSPRLAAAAAGCRSDAALRDGSSLTGRRTGSVSQPRTVEADASLARSQSMSHSGKRLEQLVERHAALEAGQRGAEAEVGAVAERDVGADLRWMSNGSPSG